MKNKYEVRGEMVIIFLNCRGKTFESFIDLESFEKINAFPNSWYGDGSSGIDYVYAVGFSRSGDKKKRISMHRMIMDAPDYLYVDHINHNTLDNRKSNLRLVTPAENQQNIKAVRKDNKTSGIRNVSFNKRSNKWIVYLNINKKRISFGQYETLEEAKKISESVRHIMMPYSNSNSNMTADELENLFSPLRPRNSNKSSKIKYIHRSRNGFTVCVKRKYYGIYESIDEAKKILNDVLLGNYEHIKKKPGPKSGTLK